MGDDWAAVAAAIRSRMAELDMSQKELVARSGVNVSTIRQLQNNYGPRRRARHTLEDVSRGLGWPAHHLSNMLDGDSVSGNEAAGSWQAELAELRSQVADLAGRVQALEGEKNSG